MIVRGFNDEALDVQISEVRITKAEGDDKRLLCYSSITLDNCLAIHNLRVIDNVRGIFVSMPSIPATVACPCGCRNHFRAKYCNACGKEMPASQPTRSYFDVAHPVTLDLRQRIETAVIKAYERRHATN